MKLSDLIINKFISESFGENSYVVHSRESKECFIIDAGFEPEQLIEFINKNNLLPEGILVTHGHMDHIAGNGAIKKEWTECRIFVGREDAHKLVDPRENLSSSYGFPMFSPEADHQLRDGDRFTVAGIDVKTLHVPGHSRGHVVYLIRLEDGLVMFVGDVIFMDSIGRTDFPDGNYNELIDGIREKILTLPEETMLYPGHGPHTTVGRERRYNPFLIGDAC